MIDLPVTLKQNSDFDSIELEMWNEGGFLRQILDIYPEAYRLEDYKDDNDSLLKQWLVLLEFVSMTMLDENVENATKEELYHNLIKLKSYYSSGEISKEAAYGWWKQWKYDLNREVARMGY